MNSEIKYLLQKEKPKNFYDTLINTFWALSIFLIIIVLLLIGLMIFGKPQGNCVREEVRCYYTIFTGKVYIHSYGDCSNVDYPYTEKVCVAWRRK
jgi:hypothetical protein